MNAIKLYQDLIEDLQQSIDEAKQMTDEQYYIKYGEDREESIALYEGELRQNQEALRELLDELDEDDDDDYIYTQGAFANEEQMRRFFL
jgi:hypothetical protein